MFYTLRYRVSTANTLDRWSYYLICRILEELTLQLRKWNKALGLTWFVNQKREREQSFSLFLQDRKQKVDELLSPLRLYANGCLKSLSEIRK